MGGLSSNLSCAAEAAAYVKRMLPRGAGNRSDGASDANACVLWVRENMISAEYWVPHLAQRAIKAGCGNCGEQASVAFIYLQKKGITPLDYMNLNDPTGVAIHSFVAIGFSGQEDDSSGWGAEAVICDPWDDGQAYAAWKINMNMSLYVSGSTVETLFRRE